VLSFAFAFRVRCNIDAASSRPGDTRHGAVGVREVRVKGGKESYGYFLGTGYCRAIEGRPLLWRMISLSWVFPVLLYAVLTRAGSSCRLSVFLCPR